MISVVVPCYNAAATVAETLRSALTQEVDKEIIVVDDGSTDVSAAVLAGFGDAIRVIATANRGASAARQTGAEAACGDHVQYLDSDDLLAPGTLAARLAALSQTGADVAHTDWQRLEPDGAGGFAPGAVRRPDVAAIDADAEAATATAEFWAPPAALLYRRALVEQIGPWPQNLPVIQDARYLFEAARRGAKFVHAPGVGAYYRVSPASLSHRSQARFIQDCAVNISEIEALWRASPPLSGVREQALADMWKNVASTALYEGLAEFEVARAGYNRAAAPRRVFEIGLGLRRALGPRGAAVVMRTARQARRAAWNGSTSPPAIPSGARFGAA